jgi:predicted nucleic acid-binding protein
MKLSHHERESQALIDYLDDAPVEVSTSVLAEVEVIRNLRKWGIDTSEAMRGFYLLTLDEETRQRANDLGPSALKALDAIHLATALAIGDADLQFVTYDERQAEAARRAGLKVVQPGRC